MTQHALTTPETALDSTGLITTKEAFAKKLQHWTARQYHVLCPAVNVGALPDGYALLPTAVQIDADPDHDEVYYNKMYCKPDEVALAKVGLRKIADCAGLTITTERVDPVPYQHHYWAIRATATWIGFDGAPQRRQSTMEWDLREGSLRLKGFKPAQIEEARKHGLRNCETRAINAVIRELGVRQKYTRAELAKPFVIVRVMFQPDMSDPETRRMAAQAHFQGVGALYPQAQAKAPAALPEPAPIEVAAEAPDHGGASGLEDLPEEPSAPSANPPPTEPVSHVTAVLKRAGGGFVVKTDLTGDRRLETEDEQVALAARTAKEAGTALDVIVERRGDRWMVVSLEPAQQREMKL
jgi:hypothetical protein